MLLIRLPKVVMTPHHAYQKLIRQEIKLVPLAQLKRRNFCCNVIALSPWHSLNYARGTNYG